MNAQKKMLVAIKNVSIHLVAIRAHAQRATNCTLKMALPDSLLKNQRREQKMVIHIKLIRRAYQFSVPTWIHQKMVNY